MKDQTTSVVEVGPEDLQGYGQIFCPNPKMPLWCNHPRVFLGFSHGNEIKCPYCSTVYRLREGTQAGKH